MTFRQTFRPAAVAVAALFLVAGTAQASQPSAITLTLVRSASDLAEISWSASGAINDAGTWSTENRIIGGSDHSNAFVVTEVLTTQVGENGSFRLRFQGRENHQVAFSGNWELYGGTGAYAGLTGTGHWYAATDQAGHLVFYLSGAAG